jgi:Zn-finger protein
MKEYNQDLFETFFNLEGLHFLGQTKTWCLCPFLDVLKAPHNFFIF